MRLAKAGVCVTMQRIIEAMHGFTTNRTPGWERALDRQYKFFSGAFKIEQMSKEKILYEE